LALLDLALLDLALLDLALLDLALPVPNSTGASRKRVLQMC
jgi:hypothetical protein